MSIRKIVLIAFLAALLLAMIAWILPRWHGEEGATPSIESVANAPVAKAAERREEPTPKPVDVKKPPQDLQKDLPAKDSESEGLVVRVRVINKATREPIVGASVEFDGYDDPQLTDAEGRVHWLFEDMTAVPEDAYLGVVAKGFTAREHLELNGAAEALVELSPSTTVVVRFEGSECRPERAWLASERERRGPSSGAEFDAETLCAVIDVLEYDLPGGLMRVQTEWLGRVIQSDPFQLKESERHEVTLHAGSGASVKVRVMSPLSAPMAHVRVIVGVKDELSLAGVTNDSGEVLFNALPAPQSITIQPVGGKGFVIVGQSRQIALAAASDFCEVVFDLSEYGIVESNLRIDGEPADGLRLEDLGASATYGVNCLDNADSNHSTLIYGLAPGQYSVTATCWGSNGHRKDGQRTAEFVILPPPEVSHWNEDLKTYTVVINVRGREAGEVFSATVWKASSSYMQSFKQNAAGKILLGNMPGDPVLLRVHGAGKVSQVIEFKPSEASELEVEVSASGTLVAQVTIAMDSRVSFWLSVEGLEPKAAAVILHLDSARNAPTTQVLAPGRYKLTLHWRGGDTQERIVDVRAGETTSCAIGPEFVTTITLRFPSGTWAGKFKSRLEKDGKVVPIALYENRGNELVLIFEAEGKFTLKLTCKGFEPIEREFEASRSQSADIELEPRKTE